MKTLRVFIPVGLLAGAALGGDLDLTAIEARVDAQAQATVNGPRRIHAAYAALQRKLAKPNVPGIVDDTRKLRVVAAACEGRLTSDTELLATLGTALDEAQAALAAASTELVQFAAALESAHDRARCGAAATKGRRLADRAAVARSSGQETQCAALAYSAAEAYRSGVALATKLLARQDARAPAWSTPLSGLGGALLSVWVEPGQSPVVYTVGAADAEGPLFLRCGGEDWVRIPVAATGDLWWVSGVGDAVFACGSQGRVVRYDPAAGSVTDLSVPQDLPGAAGATLFGVWGRSKDDVWAVGGSAARGAAIFRHDGASWSVPAIPAAAADAVINKVWGTAADDVWFCGSGGLLLHWDGAALSLVASGTPEALFTVHGNPSASPSVIAVGGTIQPAIVERGAQGWTTATVPAGSESLRGVHVPQRGDAYASGVNGALLRRVSGRWERVTGMPQTSANDYHAVHVDDQGGVWVTVGDVIGLRKGALLYFGTRTVPFTVLRQAKLRERVQPILYANCAITGCHIGPFLSEDLDLSSASAIRGVVGRPSRQSPLLLVLPGRPSQSYLWHKIQGTQRAAGGSGDRMPTTGNYLSQEDEEAVRAWILEGARDD